jgi:multidrug efflux pump
MWSQLATAIAGGLAVATVLTLILTPCMLALKVRRDERKAHKQMAVDRHAVAQTV